MKKLIKTLKKISDIILFCLGLGDKTETGRAAVRAGLCDFSGQGRENTKGDIKK